MKFFDPPLETCVKIENISHLLNLSKKKISLCKPEENGANFVLSGRKM